MPMRMEIRSRIYIATYRRPSQLKKTNCKLLHNGREWSIQLEDKTSKLSHYWENYHANRGTDYNEQQGLNDGIMKSN